MGVKLRFHPRLLRDCANPWELDFEKTFIQCIVYNYDVMKEYGDEVKVRAAGKVMTKGKDYEVADGDIILSKCLIQD